jgi:hypothetical protein
MILSYIYIEEGDLILVKTSPKCVLQISHAKNLPKIDLKTNRIGISRESTKLTGGAEELIKLTFAGLDNLLWVVWGSA